MFRKELYGYVTIEADEDFVLCVHDENGIPILKVKDVGCKVDIYEHNKQTADILISGLRGHVLSDKKRLKEFVDFMKYQIRDH